MITNEDQPAAIDLTRAPLGELAGAKFVAAYWPQFLGMELHDSLENAWHNNRIFDEDDQRYVGLIILPQTDRSIMLSDNTLLADWADPNGQVEHEYVPDPEPGQTTGTLTARPHLVFTDAGSAPTPAKIKAVEELLARFFGQARKPSGFIESEIQAISGNARTPKFDDNGFAMD